ncbi:MAG: UDP-N-acetylmuramate--L-alanine ligase [Saprospiraceae bacterium]
MKIESIDKIYFLGIGGIGMSAIARHMQSIGKSVYGYDKTETKLTKLLVEQGMEIHYKDDPTMIPEDIDMVIYTPAIPDNLLEVLYFRSNGYKLIKRAELLGMLSNESKTIAIAGTHGKTSTSATVTHLLKSGGVDISAFVGGIMNNYNNNYIHGKGEWIIVEADEYDRSFLHLSPDIAAVMSMDADHLDIYGDHSEMIEGFESFLGNVRDNGLIILKTEIINILSGNLKRDLENRGVTILEFGINEHADLAISNILVKEGSFYFDIDNMVNVKTILPGRHNIENTAVAIKIASELGLNEKAIRIGLDSFRGIVRRFEYVIKTKDTVYIDDYAHHPTELRAAIDAAKELYPNRQIIGIFQPHLFSRTRDFVDGFADALGLLDEVVLLDIYPAREEPIPGVTSKLIYDKIKIKQKSLVEKSTLLDVLKTKKIEILMTLGAGDIGAMVNNIKEIIINKQ